MFALGGTGNRTPMRGQYMCVVVYEKGCTYRLARKLKSDFSQKTVPQRDVIPLDHTTFGWSMKPKLCYILAC
ncbi:hypothetical protein E2P81_ATG07318 [Venturia nashicola]|uniref:Uncharacterized protein n=1 Tax=Venturia nashicola TaxID=86259 RepID=A0A4Z1PDS7_9PEZI|nr:hypothetical protein E6O75_ATG07476 [Venturia nashicola]TLD31828.1 hypothetical protein E2P81_ATG07318 [Venturia nashicola]